MSVHCPTETKIDDRYRTSWIHSNNIPMRKVHYCIDKPPSDYTGHSICATLCTIYLAKDNIFGIGPLSMDMLRIYDLYMTYGIDSYLCVVFTLSALLIWPPDGSTISFV